MERNGFAGMKLSELRPCDFCGGQLVHGNAFKILEIKIAMLGRGTQEVLGLAQYFGSGGAGFGIAEAMAPRADEAILVGEDPGMIQKLLICYRCFEKLDFEKAIARMEAATNDKKAQSGEEDPEGPGSPSGSEEPE